MIALARSWRPEQPLPGARTWEEVQGRVGIAALEVERHLAIEPPPAGDLPAVVPLEVPPLPGRHSDDGEDQDDAQAPDGPVDGAGWRLRLAVTTAARDGDREAVAALIQHGATVGLDGEMLLAVAQAHWPAGSLPLRVCRGALRWLRRRTPRPRRAGGRRAVVQR
jgi:hypothetical protein